MHKPDQEILLLVLPLPIYESSGAFFLDTQACNGLRLWLQNFDTVIMCNPAVVANGPPPGTSNLRELLPGNRLEIYPLPAAWTPLQFFRALPRARSLLLALIGRATHLQFAIGGIWGDWGAVAAVLAANQGRKGAIWTDRVESYVMRVHAARFRGARRFYRLTNAWLAGHLERFVISRSAMGLFHGMDTYSAYARYSRSPHLVHDVHLGPECRISVEDLGSKMARPANSVIKIVYGGRVHPDKGVDDWIETLSIFSAERIPFQATWHGDGPELLLARRKVASFGLEAAICFPGPTTDRQSLLRAFRDADIFLFCHKTLELPRCLVEALLSGTPIVGYDSPYPRDLVARNAGGAFSRATPEALSRTLLDVAGSRPRLGSLAEAAAADGYPLVDSEVFRHRSELIKSLTTTGRERDGA